MAFAMILGRLVTGFAAGTLAYAAAVARPKLSVRLWQTWSIFSLADQIEVGKITPFGV